MKISVQAERAAQEAYYQALAAQFAGGKMQIFTQQNELLVEVPFPNDVAIATSGGFIYSNIAEQEVKKMGDPARFTVLSSRGHILMEGSMGLDANADIQIEQKHSRLFPGMKFGIEEFAYSKA